MGWVTLWLKAWRKWQGFLEVSQVFFLAAWWLSSSPFCLREKYARPGAPVLPGAGRTKHSNCWRVKLDGVPAPYPFLIRKPMAQAPRPTILILTTQTGGGHLNLAQSLKGMLEVRYEVAIVDGQPDSYGSFFTT